MQEKKMAGPKQTNAPVHKQRWTVLGIVGPNDPPAYSHAFAEEHRALVLFLSSASVPDTVTLRWHLQASHISQVVSWMHKHSTTPSQYLVEPPSNSITAADLLGFVPTSFAHIETEIFTHSSFLSQTASRPLVNSLSANSQLDLSGL